ncbi:serine/threonine protein phosphatase 2A 57 kDa regulatory subunit B' kappa isoform-like [Olea europaea var. sylvestris]|uniref:Serine/threonine protein phosphatase 2A regulatory subunit n=1 Tax=Olea europaea subsp. europaea TaxID=158383 RepID=A0A8S0UC12_OLEEU|nr:serine/threonine protein phosphatase 2A 57 kDa regulatory subunit B' kappa isoform-like [Olea europaea var. sylvestris]XP_022881538.1 serine/threonine protein phosphatase 2A 57 kDa regulatory subunit B' kappa isoform-like [Olea europaea var. sylvestris]XP_022881539.1 serine/threonine protein phosphatase 2A 57 kDa regulatory subunit B' kappa isoform-like [Olea europaea var. sylvestris]CAA3014265.1 serine threonine phosphatase 2A 57 kDa regulatory subunit B iota isoform [Olea europaea subsp. eu
MWKQILSKLPRKSTKSDVDSARIPNSSINTSSPGSGRANAASPAVKRAAVFPASVIAGIEPMLAFKDVPSSEKLNLFISKLSLCCVVFDFIDPVKNTHEKELKRATLLELLDFVSQNPPKFSEPAILAACKMCSINIFRNFPPNYQSSNTNLGENDNDSEPTFDPAWSHLQIVYDFLLKFVTSPSLEAKVAKKYINHSFILRTIDLFHSEDPRERDCLKAILHRIYGKFMVHRPFVRKSISHVFYRFVFETEKHNGIAELLEIFGSVITGFALPLKEEHKIFLWRALIPLHKPKSLAVYFQQLSYCVTQFIEKEPKLAGGVIKGLLKYWPITNSQKEVMFLSELEEILEAINMAEFQKVMVPLFWRIGQCINSFHFQVAERALFFWNNDQVLNLIAHNRHVILPIILPALESNAQNHWNQAVLNLSLNVKKMFSEMDDSLVLTCISIYNEEQEKLNFAVKERKEVWKLLENAASRQPIAGNTAVLVSP